MRSKKRYIRLKQFITSENLEFMFQDDKGYVFKTTPKQAERLREEALLISGSIRNLKSEPKVINRRTKQQVNGMK
jgi:hypothetical protein